MISILIMSYNGEKYISQCMDSLINQTIGMENIEIVILDDVSTDSTVQMLQEYKRKYPQNIHIIKNAAHSSITKKSNRNEALKYASGEYVLFLDQDDWYELNTIQILKKYIDQYPELDYIEFGFQCINEEDNTCQIHTCKESGFHIYEISNENKRNEYAIKGILPGSTFAWNKLYRKQFLLEYNIYHNEKEQSSGFADNFFSGLLVMNCRKIAKLDTALYNYRIYTGSYSHDKKKNSTVQFERCRVGLFFYEECIKRGLLSKNPLMTEYIFCRTFLLKTFWKFLMQYDPIPFDKLAGIQSEMREKFPCYKSNTIMQNMEGIQALFDILDEDWTEDYLLKLRNKIEQEIEQGYIRKYMYLA